MKPTTKYIGLDVHKATISVAVAVNRPFNRGYLSTPVSYPCRGQGPFRGLSLMIVFGAGASTC